jgi:dihydropteroate synthase
MNARLLDLPIHEHMADVFSRLGVHAGGVRIMADKAGMMMIHLEKVSAYAARIIKQDMLSIGGDCAMPAEALIKNGQYDCVLLGTRAHLKELYVRLARQTVSLKEIALAVKTVVANAGKKTWILDACGRRIRINKPLVMGIVNVTPDSFSGDGLLAQTSGELPARGGSAFGGTIDQMVKAGVDMFDVGGESTRPGSRPVSVKEECARVIPVIKMLTKKYPRIPVSIDTYKPEVARAAIAAGACMVNDITGLASADMARLVARTKAAVCIMHMKGTPRTMQKNPVYTDVVREVFDFFLQRIERARKAGIADERIVLDVGIGFGKRLEDNIRLLQSHHQFKSLGFPLLLGVSRKAFIGALSGETDPAARVPGTLAAMTLGLERGARILRVHDVPQAVQALKVARAITSLAI